MKKVYVFLACLLTSVVFFAPVSVHAEENDTTPWFIGENSYFGTEYSNPEYNETWTWGTEWTNANQVVSGTATEEGVSRFQKITLAAYLLPGIFFLALFASVYYTRKKIVTEKKSSDMKLSLEERRIALEEKRFEAEQKRLDEEGVKTSKGAKAQSKKPQPKAPVEEPNYGLGDAVAEAFPASAQMMPTDTNCDGIVDALDIPTFIQH